MQMDDSIQTAVTDDQVSEYCPKQGLQEAFQINEVLDDLKCEVRELSKKILTSAKGEVTRVSLNPDQTVVLPERSVSLKRKTQIVNSLRVEMELDKSLDLSSSVAQALLTYSSDIVRDVKVINQCIAKKVDRKENLNSRMELLETSKVSLQSFEDGLKESKINSVADMEPFIMQDFHKIKETFNRFLRMISPSGILQEILEKLVQCSSGEGDEQYIDITDENFAWITMLRKASIVVNHPLRASKVTLDSF